MDKAVTPPTNLNEADIAAQAIEALRSDGWQVYQEVSPKAGGTTLDILAVQGGLFLAIECKMAMNITLLHQAASWWPYVHHTFALVPEGKIKHFFWRDVAKTLGVGLIEIQEHKSLRCALGLQNATSYTFYENQGFAVQKINPLRTYPLLNRRPNTSIWKRFLAPEYQNIGTAGASGGAKLTPFRTTVLQMVDVVTKFPGIPLAQLVSTVNTHWKRPKVATNAIIGFVRSGVISELKLEKAEDGWRVYIHKK